MKQRLFVFAVLLMAIGIPQFAKAYSFSAVAPSGQTLYYDITDAATLTVNVTYPGHCWSSRKGETWYCNWNEPSGDLVIPQTVENNGVEYTVTGINESSFRRCSELTSVSIPSGVKTIGNYAFAGCSGLTSLVLPDSLQSIGSYILQDSKVISIEIPEKVSSISSNAFNGLLLVNYANRSRFGNNGYGAKVANGYLDLPDTVIYRSMAKDTVVWAARSFAGTIPASVVAVLNDAFNGCTSLTSANLPLLSYVGENAFRKTGITSITFTENLDTLRPGAFAECSLTTVTLPSSVKSIGYQAFGSCPNLVTVNYNCDSATYSGYYYWRGGDSPFGECTNLTTVNIGSNVVRLPDYLFREVSALTTVNFASTSSLTAMGNMSFYGTGVTEITIPRFVISGNRAFAECKNLSTVHYDADSCIGNGLFMNDSDLVVVTFGNTVKYIPDATFQNCTSLAYLTLPQSLVNIGGSAFQNCTSLNGLTFPDNVKAINGSAFNNTGITEVIIHRGVRVLGPNAFSNCLHLATVHYNADSCASNNRYWDDGAFSGLTSLTTVTFGEHVKVLPMRLFRNCTSITGEYMLPTSLVRVEEGAFDGCTSIDNITVPDSVETSSSSFNRVLNVIYHGRSNLKQGFWDNLGGSGDGPYYVNKYTKNDIVYADSIVLDTVVGCRPSLPRLDIPSGVKVIADNAFSTYDFMLTEVTLPTTLKGIGSRAFADRFRLSSIDVPSSVDTIGSCAFSGVPNINYSGPYQNGKPWCALNMNSTVEDSIYYQDSTKRVVVGGHKSIVNAVFRNSVTTIVADAFRNCDSLKTISLNNGLRTIGDRAFQDCDMLESVTFPDSLYEIGHSAFLGCDTLKSVIFPRSGETRYEWDWSVRDYVSLLVGSEAFKECRSLETIEFFPLESNIHFRTTDGPIWRSELQEHLYDNCQTFRDCVNLRNVIGLNALSSIPSGMFEGCIGLVYIDIPDNITQIGHYAFSGCSSLQHVSLSDNVGVIEAGAFRGSGIKDLFTNATIIGDEAFAYTNLVNISFPENAKARPSSMLNACYNLQYISVHKTYRTEFDYDCWCDKRIYSEAESNFKSVDGVLFQIKAPRPVQNSWDSPDWNNVMDTNILSVYPHARFNDEYRIPDGVVTIEDGAFNNAFNIRKLIVPTSVQHIGNRAFDNWTYGIDYWTGGDDNLMDTVVLLCSAPTLGDESLTGFKDNTVFLIPCGSAEGYREGDWANFTNYVEQIGFTYNFYSANTSWGEVEEVSAACSANGLGLQANAAEGYHFSHWSDNNTNNPRYKVLDSDWQVTAFFAPDTFTVSLSSTDANRGMAIGNGSFTYGTVTPIGAVPTFGNRFVRWSDGNTDNPRQIIVNSDFNLNAVFEERLDTIHIVDTLRLTDTLLVDVPVPYAVHDTTKVYLRDTLIINSYSYDTSIYNHFRYDTTLVYDTMIVNVYTYDTSIYNNYRYDTVILNTYQYDTTLVNIYDTVINNIYQYDTTVVNVNVYDTTIVNNYQYDTSIYNHFRYDTTLVYDTMIVNVYTYDTSIYNNYRYDTVILNTYQYDTTLVNVFDTVINNIYQYDTTVVNVSVYDTTIVNNYQYDTSVYNHFRYDTTLVYDTMIVNVYTYDTSIYNNYRYDTVILNTYQYDTTLVNIYDTVINNTYQYDTNIYNHFRYDTTLVYDTMIVNVYTYDTSIYNNYRYDTVILNTYQYDTTLVNIFDTVIYNVYQYDTTLVYDTTIVNIYDTTINNLYQYDTITVNYYQYDTVLVNHYTHDTVSIYYHDTVNNYFYDTVIITHMYHDTVIVNNYIYDTIYLYRYIFDTVYIHDTVYVTTQEGIGDVETMNARIFQRDGQIVVESGDGLSDLPEVVIYDAVGRRIASSGRQGAGEPPASPSGSLTFPVPASGVYLVKIGDYPARKVVVIK